MTQCVWQKMAGCVKYCTPSYYVEGKNRRGEPELKLGECKCTLLKRLDCFKHVNKDPKKARMNCGQFKTIIKVSNPEKCDRICANQLAGF